MKPIPNTLLTSIIRNYELALKKITGSSVGDLELKRRITLDIKKLKKIK